MKKFTKEKGITLIALIITIIVMLILVAVTISVALNGGLFEKARNAAEQTQLEANKESLQHAIISAMGIDGVINFTELNNEAENLGFTVKASRVYGKDGYIYKVNKTTGIITVEKAIEVPADLETYLLGNDLQGLPTINLLNQSYQPTNSDVTFVNGTYNDSTIIDGNNVAHMYLNYKNDGRIYVVKLTYTEQDNPLTYSTVPEEGPNKIKVLENVGKTATINGEKYIVLYDAGEKGENVQLVSANTYEVDNVYLGYNDNWIDWTDSAVIAAANIFEDTQSGQSVLTDLEKTIYSYNNAITTLNAKCRSVVGNTNSDILDVRCIGSNPTNKNSENTTLYTSTFLQNNPTSGTYSAGAFNGVGKGDDSNNGEDYIRLLLIGANESQNSQSYWLASRRVYEDSSFVNFYVWLVRSNGYRISFNICYVDRSNAGSWSNNYGVRPVVYLDSEVLADYLDEQ